MKLQDTIRLHNLKAAVAGTQATVVDSRSSDDWIKKFLSDKQKRLDDLRKNLHNLLDHPPGLDEYMRPEQTLRAAYREDKRFDPQKPGRVGGYGKWAVVTPEGEILSRWPTKQEADEAAWPVWRGLKTSDMGPAGKARVVELSDADEITDVFAGGPGSGCRGENCGRPAVYHGTLNDYAKNILQRGLLVSKAMGTKRIWASELKKEALRYAIQGTVGAVREKMIGKSEKEITAALKRKQVALVVIENPGKAGFDADSFAVHETPVSVPARLISRIEIYNLSDALKSMRYAKDAKPVRVMKAQATEAPALYIAIIPSDEDLDIEAADIFEDPQHQDKTRSKFKVLRHPKPEAVRDADIIRMGDNRPSSHGQGAAGTGGAGAGGAGGGTGI